QKLINFLNQLLSNQFVMYVKLHRYHWFVQVRHFFQLHEKLEELYNMHALDLDEVAERILLIYVKSLSTLIKYLNETTLEAASADEKENEIIDQLTNDYQQIITENRDEGIPLASEQNDEPTADMLISIQAKLEKYVWMFGAYRAYE